MENRPQQSPLLPKNQPGALPDSMQRQTQPSNRANYAVPPTPLDEVVELPPIAPTQPPLRFPMAPEDPDRTERLRRRQEYAQASYEVAVQSSSREEYLERMKHIEEKFIAGNNPSRDPASIAYNSAHGEYAPKGKYEPITLPAALRRALQKKNGEKITKVELPDGTFRSARHLRKNSTELLVIDPRALYHTKNGYKGYVGELARSPENDATLPGLVARMQHMNAMRSIHQQENHLWQRREQGEIAGLSTIPVRYKRELQRLFVGYAQARDAAIHAFKASELPMYQRNQLVGNLKTILTTNGSTIHAAINRHANNVRTRVHNMNQIAEGALDQHEKGAVEEARRYMDAIAEEIKNRGRGWRAQHKYHWGGRMIKEGIDSLLPQGEHTPERNMLVRVALNEHLLTIAEKLAQEGDYQQAREMLSYFQKIGVIHKHTQQAINIIIDSVYTDAIVAVQNKRTIPGVSRFSYLTRSGRSAKKERLLPIVAKAFSNKDAYTAAEVVTDSVIVTQIEEIRAHKDDLGRAMDYTVENMHLLVSSMNDSQVASVYRAFFEASPADPAAKEFFLPNENDESRPITPVPIPPGPPPSAKSRSGIRKILRFMQGK